MADINAAYVEIRLSGGSGNTDPDASLGGDLSSERVLSQSTTALSNITGVTIDYAGGNPTGAGTLAYVNSAKTLQWTPNGLDPGAAVNVPEDGRYAIFGEEGMLFVTVDFSSLPVGDESDSVTIADLANLVWDDVAKEESFAGDTEYRQVYLLNAHDADPFLSIAAFVAEQPTPGSIEIGADPAGVGDGVTRSVSSITRSGATATATTAAAHGYATGHVVRVLGADQAEYNGLKTITVTDVDKYTYAVTGTPVTPATGTLQCSRGVPLAVANENTAPAGVTFSAPEVASEAIDLGRVEAGEAAPLWIKRTIPLRNITSNAAVTDGVDFPVFY